MVRVLLECQQSLVAIIIVSWEGLPMNHKIVTSISPGVPASIENSIKPHKTAFCSVPKTENGIFMQ